MDSFFNKSKLSVGFPYKRFAGSLFYDLCVFRSDQVPEVESMLNMLRVFGCNPGYPLEYGLKSNIAAKKNKRIVYFNGASQERKMYPVDSQLKLMKAAVEKIKDYDHVFLEGLAENEKIGPYKELLTLERFSTTPSPTAFL